MSKESAGRPYSGTVLEKQAAAPCTPVCRKNAYLRQELFYHSRALKLQISNASETIRILPFQIRISPFRFWKNHAATVDLSETALYNDRQMETFPSEFSIDTEGVLMVTIKDIARQCDVAVSTVSRVLNNHPNVSDETRRKVEAACASLHYVPNASARNLVMTSSNTIALILRGFNNPFFAPIIRSIEQEISSSGYSLELHQISDEADELHAGAMVSASSF